MKNSEDFRKEIAELREATWRTRSQFVKAELKSCTTAMDIARAELSSGNGIVAGAEIPMVEKAIRTIERFLPQLPVEQRTELEAELANTKERFEHLKLDVDARLIPAVPAE
jgi:hypothetical protein